MADESSPGEPLATLLKGSRDLLNPEEIVREAIRDVVKDEIRHHLEKTLKEDPNLAHDLRDGVRALLEARALEYAALLRVGALTARLGLAAVPPELRSKLTSEVVELFSRELGQIVEKSL
jgi:hypothetical protein